MNERVANMNHFLMNILSEKYNFRHICTHIYIYIYIVCVLCCGVGRCVFCGAVCALWQRGIEQRRDRRRGGGGTGGRGGGQKGRGTEEVIF
jgi:hypothetical protein